MNGKRENYVTKKIRINNNAHLLHNIRNWRRRNFSGMPDDYSRENSYEEILDGVKVYRRSFIVELKDGDPDYLYGDEQLHIQDLVDDGWNVKVLAPREEGDDPKFFIKVNVKFKTDSEIEAEELAERSGEEIKFRRTDPRIKLKVGENETELDKRNVGTLDDMFIENGKVLINPYNNRNGGVTAYLRALQVEAREFVAPEEDSFFD